MLFFQQAEPESEIYCLFTKSWARRKVSCHFYTEVTQRHLGRTDCQARVPPVPVVPVGRGREPHSPLLPQPPWQQQIQSAGIQEIQEFRKKTCILSSNSKQGPHQITLVFLVLCLLGLIHHITESLGTSHFSA